ncbi:alpha/beta hydrolase [Coraliomargarita sp. W4R53]
MRNILLTILLSLSFIGAVSAVDYQTDRDIAYYDDAAALADPYIKERCLLDVYYPRESEGFATIVWFHGGGIQVGVKQIPNDLKGKGVAIVAPNYRLYPKVSATEAIVDAAAAVAWAFKNIESLGGDPAKIFVSGHSAGGYLASMVGLDQSYLKANGIDANEIAGLIPLSGHTITHFAIRHERGIPSHQPIVDRYAPLFHVRADAAPLLLITGDRELEMLGRYEENAFMMRMMRVAGHQDTRIMELDGYGHGGMMRASMPLLLKEVERLSGAVKP